MNQTDYIFYYIGWGIFFFFALIVCFQSLGLFTLTDIGLPCAFRAVTGYYCPGCGGTHAVCSLARGNFLKSFQEHAAVPIAFFLLSTYLFWNTLTLLMKKKRNLVRKKSGATLPALHFHTAYIYVILATILIQWVVKLIFY